MHSVQNAPIQTNPDCLFIVFWMLGIQAWTFPTSLCLDGKRLKSNLPAWTCREVYSPRTITIGRTQRLELISYWQQRSSHFSKVTLATCASRLLFKRIWISERFCFFSAHGVLTRPLIGVSSASTVAEIAHSGAYCRKHLAFKSISSLALSRQSIPLRQLASSHRPPD